MAKAKQTKRATERKVCPECGHVFQGNGWDGIDAHWRSKHEKIMPYEEARPMLLGGTYKAQPTNGKVGAKAAIYKVVGRKEGADFSKEQFREQSRLHMPSAVT